MGMSPLGETARKEGRRRRCQHGEDGYDRANAFLLAARRTKIRATVAAIDAGKPSVTFRGPEGRVQEVSVAQDPRILARLKVGETYNVSYIEHLAMVVEKTTKR